MPSLGINGQFSFIGKDIIGMGVVVESFWHFCHFVCFVDF